MIVILVALVVGACLFFAGPSANDLRGYVVKLSSADHECSGIQVRAPSGKKYILTAAHCRLIADADGNYLITLEDHTTLMRRLVAEDSQSDLLLLEGVPRRDGAIIAAAEWPREKVQIYSHGANLDTWRSEEIGANFDDQYSPLPN